MAEHLAEGTINGSLQKYDAFLSPVYRDGLTMDTHYLDLVLEGIMSAQVSINIVAEGQITSNTGYIKEGVHVPADYVLNDKQSMYDARQFVAEQIAP